MIDKIREGELEISLAEVKISSEDIPNQHTVNLADDSMNKRPKYIGKWIRIISTFVPFFIIFVYTNRIRIGTHHRVKVSRS